MNTNLIDVDKYTRRESIKNANTGTTEQNKLNRVYYMRYTMLLISSLQLKYHI